MNRLCIIGRLTKRCELRYTQLGKAVTKLSVAINNGKNSAGEQDTTFLDLDVYGNQAENSCKYLDKGSLISAECIIKNNNYEKQDGTKVYGFSFIVNNIGFLDSKAKSENKQMEEPRQEETDPFAEFGREIQIDDDNFLE